MNTKFNFNAEYLEECFKRRKKPEERIYPKKDWPVGYEPTKKEFEEWMEEGMGIPVSFHWEDIGGGRKRGVFTPIKKNSEIKGQKNELIEKDIKEIEKPKERLIYGAGGNIDGSTYFTERKGKDGVIKETYHEPRNEEEENQIIERNRKRREQEKSQSENSLIQNKECQSAEKENSQQNLPQELENKPTGVEKSIQSVKNQELVRDKNHEFPTGWIVGGGIMSVAVVLITAVGLKNKKRK